jgi:hypothetical protein
MAAGAPFHLRSTTKIFRVPQPLALFAKGAGFDVAFQPNTSAPKRTLNPHAPELRAAASRPGPIAIAPAEHIRLAR